MTLVHETWQETCLVELAREGGEARSFASKTEEISITNGSKSIDLINVISGGNLVQFSPEETTEIEMTLYPIAGDDISDWFYGDEKESASQPITIENKLMRYKFRTSMLWSLLDDSAQTASDATDTGNEALRFVGSEGYITSVEPDFSDRILSFDVTIVIPPFDRHANGNLKWQSHDGSDAESLDALGSY